LLVVIALFFLLLEKEISEELDWKRKY
jgi:hypothetical protein